MVLGSPSLQAWIISLFCIKSTLQNLLPNMLFSQALGLFLCGVYPALLLTHFCKRQCRIFLLSSAPLSACFLNIRHRRAEVLLILICPTLFQFSLSSLLPIQFSQYSSVFDFSLAHASKITIKLVIQTCPSRLN